ncbi:MAG: tolB protein [Polyangiaceae bacterium]|nr:tolB protein [Polyangiaceae bacterium]
MRVTSLRWVVALSVLSAVAHAQEAKPDESALGEFVVTGSGSTEHVPKIAVLPSLSPDMEDVVVRGTVRRNFELTGLYDVIADAKAPPGLYGFEDAVDIDAWKKLGAEAIVKVAARKHTSGKIEVFGLAYFLNVGKDPVYEKKLLVDAKDVRVTAHRITDALLGALTGRPGGFASHFVYSGRWGTKSYRIFSMDADGHNLTPTSDPNDTAIAPAWGPNQQIFYGLSKNYSPYRLMRFDGQKHERIALPFKTSIYSVAFDKTHAKMAVAVADSAGSAIYVGKPDGSEMKKVSSTELATHPVFSPSGKLAWIGGSKAKGSQRVYVDDKPVSPPGFTAGAPAFCDTEDGIRLVYSVSVGGDRHDIVMSAEKGGGTQRLTQNQGSNTSPACSPDGRLLAFFSTRKKPGTYFMSLKRWKTQQLNGQVGESLRWEALPPP